MNPPTHDNALDALERARRAQEEHDRRIDVQLRIRDSDPLPDPDMTGSDMPLPVPPPPQSRSHVDEHLPTADDELAAITDELDLGKCDAPRCGAPAEVTDTMGGRYCTGHEYLRRGGGDQTDPPARATWHKGEPCPYCGAAIWSIVRHCYRCPDWPRADAGDPDHLPTADDELTAIAAELTEQLAQLYPHLEPLARKHATELAEAAAVILNHASRQIADDGNDITEAERKAWSREATS